MSKNNKEKPALLPRLRFPEFRDCKGWQEALLSQALKFQPGFPFPSAGFNSEKIGFRLIRNRDLRSDEKPVHFSGPYSGDFVVDNGDILVGMDGDFTPCLWKKGKALLNQRVGRVLPKESSDQLFLFYFLSVHLKAIEDTTARTTVKHLSHLDVERICEPLPKKAEQQKIADCLSSLDELIAAEIQKLDALKTQKKGLIQQLFPREGETVPQLRFPEFQEAGEWDVRPLLHYIASLDAGVSVNSGDRSADNKEIGVLKTSCVSNGYFDATENKVVQEPEEMARVKEPVCANTIIISRMNTTALVGANAFVENDIPNLFLPDRLWSAKPTGFGNMRFLAYVLGSESGRAALSGLASGSSGTMKNIGKSEVLALQITAPTIAEQVRIADCLSSLDEFIVAQGQRVDALKTHKKGLMQQLFPVLIEVPA